MNNQQAMIRQFSASIIGFAQSKGRVVISFFFLIVAAGMYALWDIPKESDPDISIPIMYVSLSHDGISPEDAEQLLVKPIEQEVNGIEGVEEIQSSAYENGANVVLKFVAGFDADQALTDIREAVDKAKVNLPSETNEPVVSEVNFSLFPVLTIMLYGDIDVKLLQRTAKALQDKIEAIPEILEVNIIGEKERLVEITITPEKLEGYNLNASSIIKAIRDSNLLVAVGALSQDSGRAQVKVPGLITDPSQLLEIPLRADSNRVILLGDVAVVEQSFKESTSISRVNGKNAISLQVIKRSGENVINVTNKVQNLIAVEEKSFPDNLQYTTAQDRSVEIQNMLNDLTNNILSAVILVIFIILLFLGLSSGFLVGIAIPGSFLGGVLILYASGLSVNVVVLFGLILSVGLLVDGSIVVVEYAARRLKEGASNIDAFDQAARRMSWPIIASTATTLAAFLPLIFWPGIVGEFMKFLPITLVAVLSSSLLMALFFLPVLGTWIKPLVKVFLCLFTIIIFTAIGGQIVAPLGYVLGLILAITAIIIAFALAKKHYVKQQQNIAAPAVENAALKSPAAKTTVKEAPASPAILDAKPSFIVRAYIGVIRAILKHAITPVLVIIGAFVILGGIIAYYANNNYGVEFFPKGDPDRFFIEVGARGNLSLQDKEIIMTKVEDIVLRLQDRYEGIASVNTVIGKGNRNSVADVIGQVQVELQNWKKRPLAKTIIAPIIEEASKIPGIRVEYMEEESGPRENKPINLQLRSADRDILYRAASDISQYWRTQGDLIQITDTLPPPQFNWELEVNKEEAAKYGVNISEIGLFVRLLTQGFVATTYRPADQPEEVDIVVRYPKDNRNLQDLDRIKINTEKGPVPLSYFVERRAIKDKGTLQRIDSLPMVSIKAAVPDGVLADNEITRLSDELQTEPQFQALLQNIEWQFVGEEKNKRESQEFLFSAFIISIAIMAVILIWQFNSFSSALFILSAVIMSSCGVLVGLLVTAQPFGIIMSGIGVISLAGIVVNNNIVLIDTYDTHIKSNMSVIDALILTCQQRFRPVTLTATTTILGLLPMTLAMNIDIFAGVIEIGGPSTRLWTQISTSIIFGLLIALPLTLLVTPCMICIREKIIAYFKPA